MKKSLILIIAISIFSCNQAKESAQDAMNNALEKAIENKTGNQVELPDAESIEKNAGYVFYKSEKQTYLDGKEKMQSSVIIEKSNEGLALSFQLSGQGGKSFIASIANIPENFTLPLKGKYAVSNRYDGENPSAMIMFMNVTETGLMTSEVPYEGELILTKLSNHSVELEIKGKGGNPSDAESPSNWKNLSGKITMKYPMIQSYNIDKNNVLK